MLKVVQQQVEVLKGMGERNRTAHRRCRLHVQRGVATALGTASRIVEQEEAGIKAGVCVKLLLRNVLNRTLANVVRCFVITLHDVSGVGSASFFRLASKTCHHVIMNTVTREVTGEWRRLHNEELQALYSSTNIIRVIRSGRLRWTGYVARTGREERFIQGFGGEI